MGACSVQSAKTRMQPYVYYYRQWFYVMVNKVYQINIEKCNVHTGGRGIAGGYKNVYSHTNFNLSI